MIPIKLHISDEQAHQLTQRAHDAGYETLDAYVQALVEADMEEISSEDIKASLTRGFKEARSGRTLSEADFWRRLNDAD